MMRRPAVLALGALCASALWVVTSPRPAFTPEQAAALEQGGDVERGRLIFYAGGCASCHATPGQDDRLKLGGGLVLPSPFGRFYPPNISPHPTDGIGSWKVVDLANAMLSGVSPQASHYYPAFPYTSYSHMTVDDIRDLMVFLRGLQPVAGKAPAHALSFPFNIRRGLGLWKLLFLHDGPIPADPARSAEWNRGRYLVEGPGHCAECHSPRNGLGGIVADQRFAGGPNLEGKGIVPNITPHANGIGSWSKDDIVEVLTTGMTPAYDSVGSSMVSVVKNTAQLPDADRAAIAEYVMSLPPLAGRPKKPVSPQGRLILPGVGRD